MPHTTPPLSASYRISNFQYVLIIIIILVLIGFCVDIYWVQWFSAPLPPSHATGGTPGAVETGASSMPSSATVPGPGGRDLENPNTAANSGGGTPHASLQHNSHGGATDSHIQIHIQQKSSSSSSSLPSGHSRAGSQSSTKQQQQQQYFHHNKASPMANEPSSQNRGPLITILTYQSNHVQIPRKFQNIVALREIRDLDNSQYSYRHKHASSHSSDVTEDNNRRRRSLPFHSYHSIFQLKDYKDADIQSDFIAFLDRDTQVGPRNDNGASTADSSAADSFWTELIGVVERYLTTHRARIVGGKVLEILVDAAAESSSQNTDSVQDSNDVSLPIATVQSAGYTAHYANRNSVQLQPSYAGMNPLHRPLYRDKFVLSVDKSFVVMPVKLLQFMDYETFGEEYTIHDLCLSQNYVFYYPHLNVIKGSTAAQKKSRMKQLAARDRSSLNTSPTRNSGEVSSKFYFPRFDYSTSREASAFYTKWTNHLYQHISNRLLLPYKVAWDYGAGSCSGWFREATDFVTALEGMLPLRIITGIHDKCDGLPESIDTALDRMISHELDHLNIWISHKPPNRYPHFPYDGMFKIKGVPDYVIGRSMYEASLVPEEWVEPANTLVDEIWVPSKFLMRAFIDVGVKQDRLVHMPEPIDTYFFDPLSTKPLNLQTLAERGGGSMTQLRQKQADSKKRSTGHRDGKSVSEFNPCTSPDAFRFLSIFKWEKRKGPDVLFESYFKAFKPSDPVCLYVSTYLYMSYDPRNKRLINDEILKVARKLGLSQDELPHYEILTEVIPTHQMPALYKAANAFVLPTRGEGWGLPIMEAMTMELPTIASRFGGQLDFMTDSNSYLIDVEKEASDLHLTGQAWWQRSSSEESTKKKPMWAKPSVSHLVSLMQHVVKNPKEGKQKGERARKNIVHEYSKPKIAKRVIQRISDIMSNLNALQKRQR